MSHATNAPARPFERVYAALIGVIAIIVIFQGVWAGIFIREGKENNSTWVEVHARGAELAIVISLVALVFLAVKLRARRDLLFGSIALTVALVLESYLGGLVGDSPAVQALHFPLALVLMGLCVCLPLRAGRPTVAA